MKDWNMKKINDVVLTIWGLMLIFNLMIFIANPTFLGMFLVGVMAGGVFIMFLDHKFMNTQNRLIEGLFSQTKRYSKMMDDILADMITPPTPPQKKSTKKVKGGKKK